jgi:hypothetical protein
MDDRHRCLLHPFHRIIWMGPLGIDLRTLFQNKNIRPEERPFFRPDTLQRERGCFRRETGIGS